MPVDNAILSLNNPAFYTYVLAASIMLLKLLFQPWMTVYRMMKVRAGFRSPEDAKKSPLNPTPEPGQLEVNEYVDRSRRINLNDLESIPAFLLVVSLVLMILRYCCAGLDLDLCCRPGSLFHRVHHSPTT
jgi:hypothetical protein